MRMVYSWQEKLARQEWIHQELVAFLLTTRQTGIEPANTIEDKREKIQKTIDSDMASGPRNELHKVDAAVLREIQKVILGDSEHDSPMRFV